MSGSTCGHFRVYVGSSHTTAPPPFKAMIARFKDKLRSICTVLDFLDCDETPRGVFGHCVRNCVPKCHLMIAICDREATGLGIEMGIAFALQKPILAMAHYEAGITSILLDPGDPIYDLHRYTDLETDGFDMARRTIELMARNVEVSGPGTLPLFQEGAPEKIAAVA